MDVYCISSLIFDLFKQLKPFICHPLLFLWIGISQEDSKAVIAVRRQLITMTHRSLTDFFHVLWVIFFKILNLNLKNKTTLYTDFFFRVSHHIVDVVTLSRITFGTKAIL